MLHRKAEIEKQYFRQKVSRRESAKKMLDKVLVYWYIGTK
jgi:hypothetical protein